MTIWDKAIAISAVVTAVATVVIMITGGTGLLHLFKRKRTSFWDAAAPPKTNSGAWELVVILGLFYVAIVAITIFR